MTPRSPTAQTSVRVRAQSPSSVMLAGGGDSVHALSSQWRNAFVSSHTSAVDVPLMARIW